MRNICKFVAVAAFVALAISSAAQGQSCSQGGIPTCGGCTAYNLIYDPYFNQTSCSAWDFYSYSNRATSGTMCSNWSAPFGHFYGPMSGAGIIRQTTTALNDSYRDHFWFSYTVDIVDPQNNSSTAISANIYVNGQWVTVDAPAGGARSCETRSFDLGNHASWVGQTMLVEFDTYIPGSNATINIQDIALWQDH
ncbi:MAG: hypothetical protein QOC81_3106 [Thermoanaerobaculia bacterium]|jgi:hypothetical protein|nr:hypothetical protein [Thermoanaerobaculia bacterium]